MTLQRRCHVTMALVSNAHGSGESHACPQEQETRMIPEWGSWIMVREEPRQHESGPYGFIVPERKRLSSDQDVYARLRDGRFGVFMNGKILFLGDQRFDGKEWRSVDIPDRCSSVVFVPDTRVFNDHSKGRSGRIHRRAQLWAEASTIPRVDIDPFEQSTIQLRALVQFQLPRSGHGWGSWREFWKGRFDEIVLLPNIIEHSMYAVGKRGNRVRPRFMFQRRTPSGWRTMVDPRIDGTFRLATAPPPDATRIAPETRLSR